jgi:hypothetical protein
MSTLAHGKELNSFSEISNALIHGNSIRMVVQPDNSPNSGQSALSFFTEASAVMLRSTYLQFANTHLTTNHPGFEKTPLLENVTYRISDEGEVRIMTRIITLPDYQIKGEHSMIYILGRSVKIFTND